MEPKPVLSTQRLEAFSDGVIAIIITVMVFDLKFQQPLGPETWRAEWLQLLPKGLSYVVSFGMLAIMWINHHHLFHQIRGATTGILWLSIHLLFWMSLIPFVTNAVGSNPGLPVAYSSYGFVFGMIALAFSLLRNHAHRRGLFKQPVSPRRSWQKNLLAMSAYWLAAGLAWLSVPVAVVLFLAVPLMYLLPNHLPSHTSS